MIAHCQGGNDPLHVASSSYRVIRGGGWDYSARSLRSAYRSYGRSGLQELRRGVAPCEDTVMLWAQFA